MLVLPSVRRWWSYEASVELLRVRVGEVGRGALIRDVAMEGRIVAAYHPTLFSPTSGIATLLVEAGLRVEKGQELVRISSPELESELQKERANLLAAQGRLGRQRILSEQSRLQNRQNVGLLQVELAAARRGMERAQRSRDEGILNAVEYEEAQDAVRVAELQLDVAERRAVFEAESAGFELKNRASEVEVQQLVVDDLERRVAELIVRSPASGLVARVEIKDRDAVDSNQPLVTVVDLSAFEIEIFVPENYADDLAVPTEAVVQYEGRTHRAEVRSISPEVEGSRVRGTAVFADELPAGLKQNQRVSVRLILDTRTNVVKAPRGPFVESGGGRHVYVVNDGLANLRPIEIGSLSITEVEIVSGLEPGETIILSDLSRFESAKSILLRR